MNKEMPSFLDLIFEEIILQSAKNTIKNGKSWKNCFLAKEVSQEIERVRLYRELTPSLYSQYVWSN